LHFGAGFWILRLIVLLSFLTLFFFAQRFWVRRALSLVDRLRAGAWRKTGRCVLTLLVGLLVAVLADRLLFHFLPRRGAVSSFVQITQLWLFASSFGFVSVKVVHALEWAWSKAVDGRGRSPVDDERRTFFKYAAYVAGSIPLIAGIYGYTEERLNFTVRQAEVPVPNLPPALDGFRIVQLSDIHIGDFMPAHEVRRAVEIANGLGAHLAVLTGDLLTGKGDPLRNCVAELSRLNAPLGIWGCNGNHEVYAEAEDEAEHLFHRFGMTLLRQRSAQVVWNDANLNLIGVDYQRERHSFPASASPMLNGVEPLVRRDMPNILLSHNPNSFYRAAELGIELSLAGHTHGGQIKVEIVDHSWSPASFMTDFIAGLYRLPMTSHNGGPSGHAHLYVNRGLGTIGVPARIGVDPEITLLTLRTAA
jgi:uncharacterized protein